MNFEYFTTKVINADLEVEDIGSCAIKAFNDEGKEFILIIETQLGTCRVFTYGPAVPDFDLAPDMVNLSFQRVEFKQNILCKIIRGFLNNPSYKITQAMECTKEEALQDCKDMIEYMKQVEMW